MLPVTRSVFVQASVLLLVTLAKCQSYDSDYHGAEEAEDDHTGYTDDGHQHPDYSKYFSVDTSGQNAQIQGKADSGFVTPIEFSTFFGTPQFAFGASNNQDVLKAPILGAEPKKEASTGFVTKEDFKGGFSEYDADGFGVQDYFEQAQKQRKPEEDEVEENAEPQPGPSYISHRIPVKKGRYESEVETLKTKPSRGSSGSSSNKEVETIPTEEPIEDKEDLGFKPSPQLDLSQFQPTDVVKILEPTSGKLLYLPTSPEYYSKYAKAPVPASASVSPYQKYSFQPAASSFGTVAPFNPTYSKVSSTAPTLHEYQPSEPVSQNLKGKDCIRVNKEISDKSGNFDKQPMNCFICKDPKTGGKYEQCSYTNEPTPKSYYQSTSRSYGNPENYRNKRDESESYSDPYEEIKAKSHDYYSKPDAFEKEYYKAPGFSQSEEYNYQPKSSNEGEGEAEDKSYSEIQSEQLVKKGENCRKSHKNGVTCTVCKDPKTGANYEQCSYESAPNEKKYAYVRESKYDGEGNPIEEKEEQGTAPKPVVSEDREADSAENERQQDSAEEKEQEAPSSKLIQDEPYDVPRHFAESTERQQKAGVRGLDPELYGSADSNEKEEDEPKKYHLDEYHLKLFPQFANQETQKQETKTKPDNPYFEDLTGKKDVEKVLEEFTKKDRSNCKQIKKKGMTCYLCIDKKGIQQEECMYVSESRPQSSHVAYHEVQHIKAPGNATEAPVAPVEEASASEIQKRKKFFKKAPAVIDSEANASTNVETRVKFNPEAASSNKVNKKTKRNPRRQQKKQQPVQEDDSKDPKPQFDVKDEDGLYSAETKAVYSKALGLTLPKYMLEKTEFEEEFDRSVAAKF